MQGKDFVSPIEAQDEEVWTFVCGATVCQGQRHQSLSAPVPVQQEQCQSSISIVPIQDSTVSEEFVSLPSISFKCTRSAEAVFEKIANAVSTSGSAAMGVRFLSSRSRLFE